jgi:hypothetical protein
MAPPGWAVGLGLGDGMGPIGFEPQLAVSATRTTAAARDAARARGGAVFTLERGRRKKEGSRACAENTA